MKAYDIIDKVVASHEAGSADPINVYGDLYLHPMIKYKGLMAIAAYRHMTPRKYWKKSRHYMHANRQFVGLLDFQIIDPLWIDDKGKMNHPDLLRNVLNLLTAEDIQKLYDGRDIDYLNDEQKPTAINLLCAFIEQEVNWGIYDFQLHTHFGSTEFMYRNPEKCEYLSSAVPRDFFCSHILYLFEQLESNPNIDDLLDNFFGMTLKKTDAVRNPTIQPPLGANEHIKKTYKQHMLSYGNSVERWIEPFLDRISKLCENIGPNHLWERYYELNEGGQVRIKYECPTKDQGEDWPKISLQK
jgi:hypothetical protein